ncbi:MAG TPA: DUF6489 family protein [Alphaproteobacteria bacterium]|nr:DUF6489 family protein [Alphaproteobacteria bacterium]
MKVKIDVDCTPQEARLFFGLPDIEPMQKALLAEMEARMRATLAATDPEALFKIWLPAGVQGWEQFQQIMRSHLGGDARPDKKGK